MTSSNPDVGTLVIWWTVKQGSTNLADPVIGMITAVRSHNFWAGENVVSVRWSKQELDRPATWHSLSNLEVIS